MALETFLTPEQVEILEAVTECILPSDDGPGAAEANVMGYVRWLTSQPAVQGYEQRWQEGLDLVQSMAQSLHGKNFTACTWTEQKQVLEQLGRIPHPILQRFLEGMLGMTLGGFLCEPKYGGNRGLIGWKSVGFQRRTSRPEAPPTAALPKTEA